jgi:hypothetical protein
MKTFKVPDRTRRRIWRRQFRTLVCREVKQTSTAGMLAKSRDRQSVYAVLSELYDFFAHYLMIWRPAIRAALPRRSGPGIIATQHTAWVADTE